MKIKVMKIKATKQISFTITYFDDGTSSLAADEQYELQPLLVLWVHIMAAVDEQTKGGNPGIDFLKGVFKAFKKEFPGKGVNETEK
jgi:hypothetical protein